MKTRLMGTWCNRPQGAPLTNIKRERPARVESEFAEEGKRTGGAKRRKSACRPCIHCQRRTYVTPMKVTFWDGLRTIVVPSE